MESEMLVNHQHLCYLDASAIRLVICEECDRDYIYEVQRSSEGHGNSLYFLDESGAKKRAQARAQKKLEASLRTAVEAAPCPHCGHYQSNMIAAAKLKQAAWFWFGGVVCGILGIVLFFLNGFFGFAFLALGIIVAIAGLVVYLVFEPNKQSEETRLSKAEGISTKRKAFENQSYDNVVEEFEKYLRKRAKNPQKTRPFEFVFWVDKYQINDRATVPLRLPTGETTSVTLESDMKNDETFSMTRNVEGIDIPFRCFMRVYTHPKEK